jgi:hypothetical protein
MIYSTYVRVTYVTIVKVLITDEENPKRLDQTNFKKIHEEAVHKLIRIELSGCFGSGFIDSGSGSSILG